MQGGMQVKEKKRERNPSRVSQVCLFLPGNGRSWVCFKKEITQYNAVNNEEKNRQQQQQQSVHRSGHGVSSSVVAVDIIFAFVRFISLRFS